MPRGDADQGVRQLVLVHGHTDARAKARPEHRALVDIAAEVLADETQAIGITYAGFCLTSLPHKRLPNDQAWEKTGHRVRLLVEPGRHKGGVGKDTYIGVPYGARARMILLYLQTRAVRTNSREIELGRSLHEWLIRMGLSWGGETGNALRDQAARIASCSLKFYWEGEDSSGWEAGRFVRSGLHFHDRPEKDDRQSLLWEDRVVLDEVFWDALCRHPVPLQEAALRALVSRSASLDLYIWLAYRLHTLNGPTPIPWPTLWKQFGAGYAAIGAFRRDFCKALAPAVAAYPGAIVDVVDKGVILHPSPPPVARRLVSGAVVS